MMAASSTRYSWVADLKTGTFLANSRELVRVMGVVVSTGELSSAKRTALLPLVNGTRIETKDNNPQRSMGKQSSPLHCSGTKLDDFFSVTIDDGTDSVAVCAPKTIIQTPSSPSIEVGKTYDCILKLRQDRDKKTWFAETFIEIDNPMDEHFRWLELGHHDQSLSKSKASKLRYSNLCHKPGFPVRKRNSLEAYRLICVNFRLQQQEQQPSASQKKKKTIRKSLPIKRNPPKRVSRPSLLSRPRVLQSNANRSLIQARQENFKRRLSLQPKTPSIPQAQSKPKSEPEPQTKSLEGLLLNDLATVLQKSESEVRGMIEGLQLEGKIYQNERGEYLPL